MVSRNSTLFVRKNVAGHCIAIILNPFNI